MDNVTTRKGILSKGYNGRWYVQYGNGKYVAPTFSSSEEAHSWADKKGFALSDKKTAYA